MDIDDAGHATRLRGNPTHPITRGFLCGKVAQYLERQYNPDRLTTPLRRIGEKGEGRFTPISWDDALSEVASRLLDSANQFGPESVLPYSYAGTMGLLNGAGMDRRFFHRFGASRLDRTICSSAGGAALTLSQGIKLGTEPQQFAHSKLIIAWGANILGTNVHLWPFIVEARRKGARFYVIDPVRNRTGRTADRHFAINPGSDLALALGLIHLILLNGWQDQAFIDAYANGFEDLRSLALDYTPSYVSMLTGLSEDDVRLLAYEYSHTRPAAIRVNYGVQRSEHGGNAVRAIAALPVITGSWREIGGGLQLSTSGAFEFNRQALERPDLQRKALGREARLVNMSLLGHALNDLGNPPVKALVVYNSDPAAIAPNQNKVIAGLRRSDLFTVVLEHFQTDTADFADIVLPATTFLEHTDLYLAYGHYFLQMAHAALPAVGQARSNVAVFRELAHRCGFADSCFQDSEETMIRQILDSPSSFLQGISFEQLSTDGSISLSLKRHSSDGSYRPFAEGEFKTRSGKFEFGAPALRYSPPQESRHGDQELRHLYPLELISSKNDDSMNSTFGNRPSVDNQCASIEINGVDAVLRSITAGNLVRVFNNRGSVFLRASISSTVKAGVVRVPSVRWAKQSASSSGVNTLTSDRLTDIGEAPTFYSCLVQIEQA